MAMEFESAPLEGAPAMPMTRVQIILPAERVRILDEIAEQGGLTTRKDLINNALTLLNWAVREVKRGRTIASVDERTQRFTELQMPMLDAIAAKGAAAPVAAATDSPVSLRDAYPDLDTPPAKLESSNRP